MVAQSRGREVQVGANVQWGRSDSELYFNDVDPGDWKAHAVKLDPERGTRRSLDGSAPLRLIDTQAKTCTDIARIDVTVASEDSQFRVDPHPAWDPKGHYVVFNGLVGGTRAVGIADLTKAVTPHQSTTVIARP